MLYLGDALGSVCQVVDETGEVTWARGYEPYGEVLSIRGSGETSLGFTGEMQDSSGMVYLRARYYQPSTGRFQTRDTWAGDYNQPMSYNAWLYGNANPVNRTDPSGHYSCIDFDENGRCIREPQYFQVMGIINIPASIDYCNPLLNPPGGKKRDKQYDLTGYLAVAMTKHGQDPRVKEIASLISLAQISGQAGPGNPVNVGISTGMYISAYGKFYNLEAGGKEWDIKLKILDRLKEGVVLCGEGVNCRWVDYSTPGNIHFGYIAGLAKIDHFIAAIAGGGLEQKDLHDQNLPLELLYCFQNSYPVFACDNPADQAAVDFGYRLASKYGKSLNDRQLRRELDINGMKKFQDTPIHFHPPYPPYPQPNFYKADFFDQ